MLLTVILSTLPSFTSFTSTTRHRMMAHNTMFRTLELIYLSRLGFDTRTAFPRETASSRRRAVAPSTLLRRNICIERFIQLTISAQELGPPRKCKGPDRSPWRRHPQPLQTGGTTEFRHH